jgi:hypothetical protein
MPQPARFPTQVADPHRQLRADEHRRRLPLRPLPPTATGWDRPLERTGRAAGAGQQPGQPPAGRGQQPMIHTADEPQPPGLGVGSPTSSAATPSGPGT